MLARVLDGLADTWRTLLAGERALCVVAVGAVIYTIVAAWTR